MRTSKDINQDISNNTGHDMGKARTGHVSRFRLAAGFIFALGGLVLLGGCPTQSSQFSQPPPPTAQMQGSVYGGRQPIAGASVTAYRAVTSTVPTQIGTAVTDSSGNFTLSFSPTPSAGQIVYLTATGGDAGAGVNTAIGLLNVAGAYCASGTIGCTFPSTVNIDELTTVASTQALQRYISFVACSTITGNTLSGTCLALSGAADLAHVAKTIPNLVNVTSGQAGAFLSTAATTSPLHTTLEKLDTLADIVASCVNAAGPSATACTGLFQASLDAPDTLQAAWRIAAWPGVTAKGATLFALLATPPVYTPVLAAAPGILVAGAWTVAGPRFAYVANWTSNNVSAYRLSTATGALTAISAAVAAGTSPISVAVSPSGAFAYVANSGSGTVSAYTIDPATGALTAVSGSPFTAGSNPYSVTVSPNGAFAYVANSGDNTVSAYTIEATGALSAIGAAVAGTSPSSVTVSPNGAFAYVANNGSNDVSAYSIDSTGALVASVPGSPFNAGTSPFSVTVSPSGAYAYVANFSDSTVSAYTIAATGALTAIGAAVTAGTNPVSVTVSPNGAYAYVANFSGYTVSAYSINAIFGTLTAVTGSPFTAGSYPYSVTVSPSGAYAYVTNFGDSTVSAYTIGSSGALTALSVTAPFGAGAGPYSVTVSPNGTFAYVANDTTFGNVSAYTIDPATGALTDVTGSSCGSGLPSNCFPAGTHPVSVTVSPNGAYAYVANYGGNNVSAYTIGSSGVLSDVTGSSCGSGLPSNCFTAGTGPYSVTVSPNGAYAYVANSGDNTVSAYTIEATGALSAIGAAVATGFNPVSVTVSPNGAYAYVANYVSNTVSAYTIEATGALTANGAAVTAGTGPFSVTVSPNGAYAYVANWGDSTVSAYSINTIGALNLIGTFTTGTHPFSVTVSPNGAFAYVANYTSNNVSAYTIDPATGALTDVIGSSCGSGLPSNCFTAGTNPFSVTVSPSGAFAYVANKGSNNVSAYTIDLATGALTPISLVSPFSAGSGPHSLAITP